MERIHSGNAHPGRWRRPNRHQPQAVRFTQPRSDAAEAN